LIDVDIIADRLRESRKMAILAIDPGNVKSAYVVYSDGMPKHFGKIDNGDMLEVIQKYKHSTECLAIEMVACYGMKVGATIFETAYWTGVFAQAYGLNRTTKVYRKDVKMHLCSSMRAKDGNIRQAIIDKYPPSGGGKTPQIGVKANPGPLYGISADVWAALGVAITYCND